MGPSVFEPESQGTYGLSDSEADSTCVQRQGETIVEAAQKLFAASRSKAAKAMFLVALTRGGSLDLEDALPPGVVVIEAPALGIRDYLSRLRGRQHDPATKT